LAILVSQQAARHGDDVLYTIGHSTRSYEDLVAALRAYDITALFDIRRFPRSRTNPQFDDKALRERLPADGIAYIELPALGGRRPRSKEHPERNAGWRVSAFHGYADYAETPEFQTAFAQVVERAATSSCAIMCSELLWWRCHRRIVADYALARGLAVTHIFDAAKADQAELTSFARRERDMLRYPA
jgi:uncharacterized protein (DUF488 family)